jgi:hypothetical protein
VKISGRLAFIDKSGRELGGGPLCDLRRLLGRPFGKDEEHFGRGIAH